ncbi:hypothetical protein DM01DRAFT_1405531 [Hesseltinella vesiculosa]|uniref:Uncharacterized protein n=1 Tax=Hesseltinella vesiculosa TaxID=101127 RepID=A0A1X2GQ51_9FUNG|nr:hypothetical protein DM01DRAFT_1405531 [Hesseltinella vesiculosa]
MKGKAKQSASDTDFSTDDDHEPPISALSSQKRRHSLADQPDSDRSAQLPDSKRHHHLLSPIPFDPLADDSSDDASSSTYNLPMAAQSDSSKSSGPGLTYSTRLHMPTSPGVTADALDGLFDSNDELVDSDMVQSSRMTSDQDPPAVSYLSTSDDATTDSSDQDQSADDNSSDDSDIPLSSMNRPFSQSLSQQATQPLHDRYVPSTQWSLGSLMDGVSDMSPLPDQGSSANAWTADSLLESILLGDDDDDLPHQPLDEDTSMFPAPPTFTKNNRTMHSILSEDESDVMSSEDDDATSLGSDDAESFADDECDADDSHPRLLNRNIQSKIARLTATEDTFAETLRNYHRLVVQLWYEHDFCLGSAPGEYDGSYIDRVYWSPLEKRRFFTALDRCGPNPTAMQKRIGPTKTVFQVHDYLAILQDAANFHPHDTNKESHSMEFIEETYAKEMTDEWVDFEKTLSLALARSMDMHALVMDNHNTRADASGQCHRVSGLDDEIQYAFSLLNSDALESFARRSLPNAHVTIETMVLLYRTVYQFITSILARTAWFYAPMPKTPKYDITAKSMRMLIQDAYGFKVLPKQSRAKLPAMMEPSHPASTSTPNEPSDAEETTSEEEADANDLSPYDQDELQATFIDDDDAALDDKNCELDQQQLAKLKRSAAKLQKALDFLDAAEEAALASLIFTQTHSRKKYNPSYTSAKK